MNNNNSSSSSNPLGPGKRITQLLNRINASTPNKRDAQSAGLKAHKAAMKRLAAASSSGKKPVATNAAIHAGASIFGDEKRNMRATTAATAAAATAASPTAGRATPTTVVGTSSSTSASKPNPSSGAAAATAGVTEDVVNAMKRNRPTIETLRQLFKATPVPELEWMSVDDYTSDESDATLLSPLFADGQYIYHIHWARFICRYTRALHLSTHYCLKLDPDTYTQQPDIRVIYDSTLASKWRIAEPDPNWLHHLVMRRRVHQKSNMLFWVEFVCDDKQQSLLVPWLIEWKHLKTFQGQERVMVPELNAMSTPIVYGSIPALAPGVSTSAVAVTASSSSSSAVTAVTPLDIYSTTRTLLQDCIRSRFATAIIAVRACCDPSSFKVPEFVINTFRIDEEVLVENPPTSNSMMMRLRPWYYIWLHAASPMTTKHARTYARMNTPVVGTERYDEWLHVWISIGLRQTESLCVDVGQEWTVLSQFLAYIETGNYPISKMSIIDVLTKARENPTVFHFNLVQWDPHNRIIPWLKGNHYPSAFYNMWGAIFAWMVHVMRQTNNPLVDVPDQTTVCNYNKSIHVLEDPFPPLRDGYSTSDTLRQVTEVDGISYWPAFDWTKEHECVVRFERNMHNAFQARLNSDEFLEETQKMEDDIKAGKPRWEHEPVLKKPYMDQHPNWYEHTDTWFKDIMTEILPYHYLPRNQQVEAIVCADNIVPQKEGETEDDVAASIDRTNINPSLYAWVKDHLRRFRTSWLKIPTIDEFDHSVKAAIFDFLRENKDAIEQLLKPPKGYIQHHTIPLGVNICISYPRNPHLAPYIVNLSKYLKRDSQIVNVATGEHSVTNELYITGWKPFVLPIEWRPDTMAFHQSLAQRRQAVRAQYTGSIPMDKRSPALSTGEIKPRIVLLDAQSQWNTHQIVINHPSWQVALLRYIRQTFPLLPAYCSYEASWQWKPELDTIKVDDTTIDKIVLQPDPHPGFAIFHMAGFEFTVSDFEKRRPLLDRISWPFSNKWYDFGDAIDATFMYSLQQHVYFQIKTGGDTEIIPYDDPLIKPREDAVLMKFNHSIFNQPVTPASKNADTSTVHQNEPAPSWMGITRTEQEVIAAVNAFMTQALTMQPSEQANHMVANQGMNWCFESSTLAVLMCMRTYLECWRFLYARAVDAEICRTYMKRDGRLPTDETFTTMRMKMELWFKIPNRGVRSVTELLATLIEFNGYLTHGAMRTKHLRETDTNNVMVRLSTLFDLQHNGHSYTFQDPDIIIRALMEMVDAMWRLATLEAQPQDDSDAIATPFYLTPTRIIFNKLPPIQYSHPLHRVLRLHFYWKQDKSVSDPNWYNRKRSDMMYLRYNAVVEMKDLPDCINQMLTLDAASKDKELNNSIPIWPHTLVFNLQRASTESGQTSTLKNKPDMKHVIWFPVDRANPKGEQLTYRLMAVLCWGASHWKGFVMHNTVWYCYDDNDPKYTRIFSTEYVLNAFKLKGNLFFYLRDPSITTMKGAESALKEVETRLATRMANETMAQAKATAAAAAAAATATAPAKTHAAKTTTAMSSSAMTDVAGTTTTTTAVASRVTMVTPTPRSSMRLAPAARMAVMFKSSSKPMDIDELYK